MSNLKIKIKNAIHMTVDCERGISQELSDYFSFRPPNYLHHPKFKCKLWDGYIRLYNTNTRELYVGLLENLLNFCKERGYKVDIDKNLYYGEDVPDDYGYKLAKALGTPMQPYDYQNKYVVEALRDGRSLNLSPTSSGKSFIQYLIANHYVKIHNYRVLIIVPRLQLTEQMKSDFISYGCDSSFIGMMGDGVKKDPKTNCVVSTWQTLSKLNKSFFEEFDVVLGDEAHSFESKSLTKIMDNLDQCYYRHGFTGTISSESKMHKIVLEGMFGKVRKYVATHQLIEQEVTADFKIKALLLNHSKEDKKRYREEISKAKDGKSKYPIEKSLIKQNENRNIFIRNLVWSLNDSNNLILFDDVDTHGKIIADMLQKEGRIVFFIHGKVSVEEREMMKQQIENDPIKRYDIVASSGTTSTGVSIKRIDNAIFTMGTKGEVKTLQSIGRLLRRGNGSDNATLYDIGDLLSNNKSTPNYSYIHFTKRLEIYNSEKFNYKIIKIDL